MEKIILQSWALYEGEQHGVDQSKKLKFFDDSTIASTFTERKRAMPDEVTNPDKENMKYYVNQKTSLKEILNKVLAISAIHY